MICFSKFVVWFGLVKAFVDQKWEINWDFLAFVVKSTLSITKLITKFTKTKESTTKAGLKASLEKGNHKSASSQPSYLNYLINKDVHCVFQLLINKESAMEIPHSLLAPWDIVEQSSSNEKGKIVPKLCLAHNQSFILESGSSVNNSIS